MSYTILTILFNKLGIIVHLHRGSAAGRPSLATPSLLHRLSRAISCTLTSIHNEQLVATAVFRASAASVSIHFLNIKWAIYKHRICRLYIAV